MPEKFWMTDLKELFKNMRIIPSSEMTNVERLNSLTRLLIVVTIVMYILGYEHYMSVLILGLLLIIILRNNQPRENFSSDISDSRALKKGIRTFIPGYDSKPHVAPTKSCWFDQDVSLLNATYEVTPPIQFNHFDDSKRSYMNAKYELTPLTEAEGFTQIWRTEPDMCGGYSMVPDGNTISPLTQNDSVGQCNYIVRSGIDMLPISQAQNGLNSVRPIAEASYNQSVLDFRSSIMNEHVDRFRRERQHNCPDMKLNAFSAGSGSSV
jgi:hypothetical protein